MIVIPSRYRANRIYKMELYTYEPEEWVCDLKRINIQHIVPGKLYWGYMISRDDYNNIRQSLKQSWTLTASLVYLCINEYDYKVHVIEYEDGPNIDRMVLELYQQGIPPQEIISLIAL